MQELVRDWRESVAPLVHSDEIPIRPERLCGELTQHLPSDAILVSDTGHSGIWTGTMVDLKHPDQSYIRCSGSLGWGLPAAMGAKCACPDRPVVCFNGDGGMWYHLTELETAARYGIHTVTVVNNNHSLNQEKRGNEVDLWRTHARVRRAVDAVRRRLCPDRRVDGLFRHHRPPSQPALQRPGSGLVVRQTGRRRRQNAHRRHRAAAVDPIVQRTRTAQLVALP